MFRLPIVRKLTDPFIFIDNDNDMDYLNNSLYTIGILLQQINTRENTSRYTKNNHIVLYYKFILDTNIS